MTHRYTRPPTGLEAARRLARAILGDIIYQHGHELREGTRSAGFHEMLDQGRDIYVARVSAELDPDALFDRLVAAPALKLARVKFDPYYVGLRVQRKRHHR